MRNFNRITILYDTKFPKEQITLFPPYNTSQDCLSPLAHKPIYQSVTKGCIPNKHKSHITSPPYCDFIKFGHKVECPHYKVTISIIKYAKIDRKSNY